jgi:endonuclease III
MNESLFPNPRTEPDDRLPHIHRLLLGYFGQPEPREPWDPLSQFIYSLISPRTKTDTTYAVVRNLRNRFGTWENLRDASLAEIEQGLEGITFPDQKALHLKASLEGITARVGELTLDFLARYRTDKIRTWLEQFPGVGPKTSAAVVNFSTLRRRALCVDSHHLRVTQRLGLTPRADAATTEERLMRLVPETWDAVMLDDHHQLIKKLGQTICTFEDPECPQCPLRTVCAYAKRQAATADGKATSAKG